MARRCSRLHPLYKRMSSSSSNSNEPCRMITTIWMHMLVLVTLANNMEQLWLVTLALAVPHASWNSKKTSVYMQEQSDVTGSMTTGGWRKEGRRLSYIISDHTLRFISFHGLPPIIIIMSRSITRYAANTFRAQTHGHARFTTFAPRFYSSSMHDNDPLVSITQLFSNLLKLAAELFSRFSKPRRVATWGKSNTTPLLPSKTLRAGTPISPVLQRRP